jgi:hypothetical protein
MAVAATCRAAIFCGRDLGYLFKTPSIASPPRYPAIGTFFVAPVLLKKSTLS